MKKTNGVTGSRILGENIQKRSRYVYALYSLDYKAVKNDSDINARVDLIRVGACIYLSFGKPWKNKSEKNNRGKFVFMLNCTELSLRYYMEDPHYRRFFDYRDFLRKAEENPFLALLRDCAHITEETFAIIRRNPYCQFQLAIDPVLYAKKVMELGDGSEPSFLVWKDYGNRTILSEEDNI